MQVVTGFGFSSVAQPVMGRAVNRHNLNLVDGCSHPHVVDCSAVRVDPGECVHEFGTSAISRLDSSQRDKGIDVETVFTGIESALVLPPKSTMAKTRISKSASTAKPDAIEARHGTLDIDTELLGRIAAQSGKQIMMQRFREAERDALFDEIQHGTRSDRHRNRHACRRQLDHRHHRPRTEAILPRGEQLPGESFRPAANGQSNHSRSP